MGEYALYDFTESLARIDLKGRELKSVVKAWGLNLGGNSWEGGFVLRFGDGTYAYLSGWCDTTGWGCQDDAEIKFADSMEELGLPAVKQLYSDTDPVTIEWDEYPADLNLWIEKGCPDPYSL